MSDPRDPLAPLEDMAGCILAFTTILLLVSLVLVWIGVMPRPPETPKPGTAAKALQAPR